MIFTGGLPETRCGLGSTLATTAYLRPRLEGLFKDLGITSILDAPCGDFNWMSKVDLTGIDYTGLDNSDENLKAARRRAPHRLFMRWDVLDYLPGGRDLMLCRDFHQHLPDFRVKLAFKNFKTSGIPWILATSFNAGHNTDIDKDGMFRPINLLLEPFCFPQPQAAIEDPFGSGRVLCLWHRDEVP